LKFPRGVVKGTFLKGYYLLRKISEGVKHFFEISEGVKKNSDNFRRGARNFRGRQGIFGKFPKGKGN
jgi:hypothetical protein